MGFQLPGGIEAVFGGATRAKILGYLAGAATPRTGYRVAKELQIGVSKVYPELKKLNHAGVLAVGSDLNGRQRYLLVDEDLRRFLLRRVRIQASGERLTARVLASRAVDFKKIHPVQRDRRPRASGRRRLEEEFRRPRKRIVPFAESRRSK